MTQGTYHSLIYALPARTRLALVLLLSALLHVALLSRLPQRPVAVHPTVFEVTLDDAVPSLRAPARKVVPPAAPAPAAPRREQETREPLRSIFDATRDTFRTEIERGRRGASPGAAPLPELPALGTEHQRPTGLVRSDRLAGGGTRYEYRDREGRTIVWECPEPNPNDSFALNLCGTAGWR